MPLVFIFLWSPFNFRGDNDIALLHLSEDAVFSDRIAPACLPSTTTNTFAGEQAIVSGTVQRIISVTFLNYQNLFYFLSNTELSSGMGTFISV
jgi:hypothetical protein